jgi:hypothetical protein
MARPAHSASKTRVNALMEAGLAPRIKSGAGSQGDGVRVFSLIEFFATCRGDES